MRIASLDLADDADLAAHHRLYKSYMEYDRPDQPVLGRDGLRATLTAAHPGTVVEHLWAIADDGTPIAYADMVMPQTENRSHVHSIGWVDPAHRRRGVGRALYRALAARATELGRTELMAVAHESIPGGSLDHSPAGRAFCESNGLRRALVEIRRRLDVAAVDPARLDTLATTARSKAAGYEILVWRDRADDAIAADLASLEGRLHADVPTGDLDLETASFDVDRWRGQEETNSRRGRTVHFAAARHVESGRLAAYTALMTPNEPRTHAIQQTTVVAPEHRGRSLGLLVKLANLAAARDREPDLAHVDTTNADDNAHMIAINDAMGFVLADATVIHQGPIASA